MTTQMSIETLETAIQKYFSDKIETMTAFGELTIELSSSDLIAIATALRDEQDFQFDMLIDICGVDYLRYGHYDWETVDASTEGYSRGVSRDCDVNAELKTKARFALVYHLLSTVHNVRCRLRVFLDDTLQVPSVNDIWNAANWFEREAYDLFGIWFQDHPDLRRILTDYGFVGHPFRKDFPLSGHVEMRYDAKEQRCIYEPVDIEPRVLVPKVFRDDSRYVRPEPQGDEDA